MQRFRALYVAIAICFLESAGFREVRADKPYKTGELVLVPMTSLKLVSIKDPELERTDDLAGNAHVHCKDFDLTIAGPPKPKSKEQKSWSDDALVVPYWWVAFVQQAEDACMEMATKVGNNGTKVPCLINTKALPKHAKLTMLKPSLKQPSIQASWQRGQKRKAQQQDN